MIITWLLSGNRKLLSMLSMWSKLSCGPFGYEIFRHIQSANLHRLKVLVERSETLQPDSIQCESVFPSAALGSVFTCLLGQPDNERVAIESTFDVQNSPTESA